MVSYVSSTQGIIFKLNYLPTEILLMIYYSLVFPYLFYCIEIWGACPASTRLPLYRLQKKIVRNIYKLEYNAHANPAFYNLNILKLDDIFRFFINKKFFEILRFNKSSWILQMVQDIQVNHMYSTRNLLLRMPSIHICRFKQSFIYQSIYNWNLIPDNLKNFNSILTFKNHFKKHIIAGYNEFSL